MLPRSCKIWQRIQRKERTMEKDDRHIEAVIVKPRAKFPNTPASVKSTSTVVPSLRLGLPGDTGIQE